jgi:hypothetical protein
VQGFAHWVYCRTECEPSHLGIDQAGKELIDGEHAAVAAPHLM